MKKTKKMLIALWLLILLIVLFTILWLHPLQKMSKFKIENEEEKIKVAKENGDDITGWLRVEGTNIDLALVETNGVFDIYKDNYQYAWTNSHPDDTTNHPTFISHNVRNVSKNPIKNDDNMNYFEQLLNFIYPEVIKENQYIEYTNEKGEASLYRIYAVSLTDEDIIDSYSDAFSKDELASYIKKSKENSIYDIAIDVDENDMLLTLTTCTRFYGASPNYSFIVDARKVREKEKQTLARVRENKNYQKIEDRMKEGEEDEEV